MTEFTYPEQHEIFAVIAKTKFRPFDKYDWFIFAGCESKEPMIGEHDGLVLVLDNDCLNIVHPKDEYGGVLYQLTKKA